MSSFILLPAWICLTKWYKWLLLHALKLYINRIMLNISICPLGYFHSKWRVFEGCSYDLGRSSSFISLLCGIPLYGICRSGCLTKCHRLDSLQTQLYFSQLWRLEMRSGFWHGHILIRALPIYRLIFFGLKPSTLSAWSKILWPSTPLFACFWKSFCFCKCLVKGKSLLESSLVPCQPGWGGKFSKAAGVHFTTIIWTQWLMGIIWITCDFAVTLLKDY